MPYVIVSTVAILSNLYKNAPLIVGDKDSDPDLMRYLGARVTTNYPACGSPPMYVMHASPRAVFDNLEKRGYCLVTAQIIQEHAVWVLARPRIPEDDKLELERRGPNDKSSQINSGEKEESGRKPSSVSKNDSRAESALRNSSQGFKNDEDEEQEQQLNENIIGETEVTGYVERYYHEISSTQGDTIDNHLASRENVTFSLIKDNLTGCPEFVPFEKSDKDISEGKKATQPEKLEKRILTSNLITPVGNFDKDILTGNNHNQLSPPEKLETNILTDNHILPSKILGNDISAGNQITLSKKFEINMKYSLNDLPEFVESKANQDKEAHLNRVKWGVAQIGPEQKEVLENTLLLDDFTQTVIGDSIRIPKLPKVEDICETHEPSKPPSHMMTFSSETSLTHCFSEIYETSNSFIMCEPNHCLRSTSQFEKDSICNEISCSHLSCLPQCEVCCCEELNK